MNPRALRLRRELSQSDLARLAGVSPSAISQVERGERGLSLETLLALAGRLNITLDELRHSLAAGTAHPVASQARFRRPGDD